VGTHVTALNIPFVLAFEYLDIDLTTKVGNDETLLFRAEIAPFQLILDQGVTSLRTGSPLFLDLADAPGLTPVYFTFSHTSRYHSLTATVVDVLRYSNPSEIDSLPGEKGAWRARII